MNHTHIINELKQALSLSDNASLTEIQGGEVNRVFKLKDGEMHFAVKSLARDEFSGINRFHQFLLQEQLAHREIAPAPVWLNKTQDLWVESWLEKSIEKDISVGGRPGIMADILAQIHHQPITVRPLDLPQRLYHYIDRAGLKDDDPRVRRTQQVIRQYALDYVPAEHLVLCHNDLSWGHIQSLDPVMIVDWEYAAMGNRFFDLASCASINRFDEKDTDRLISRYAQRTAIAQTTVEHYFREQRDVVDVTETLWSAALEATSDGRADQVL
ncbi:phosphotransferase [Salinimonas sp. HHU 13199]|uniref:Phosphotransferase n=1 Tax=Salinimonas profundi TaxID=2729140 RepID=A0ABR8LI69_9ALTE|nr:phosphotransferase [Salinimonas profundi]MBD3585248.1 phosphotransferase [Salinimonas profundi]